MNKQFITGAAISGLVLAVGTAGMVSADSVATETGLTEEQVIEIALAEVAGQVQEVELETEDGMQVYEVEIIAADGAEFEVEIAALTGDVLEVEAEDDDDS